MNTFGHLEQAVLNTRGEILNLAQSLESLDRAVTAEHHQSKRKREEADEQIEHLTRDLALTKARAERAEEQVKQLKEVLAVIQRYSRATSVEKGCFISEPESELMICVSTTQPIKDGELL